MTDRQREGRQAVIDWIDRVDSPGAYVVELHEKLLEYPEYFGRLAHGFHFITKEFIAYQNSGYDLDLIEEWRMEILHSLETKRKNDELDAKEIFQLGEDGKTIVGKWTENEAVRRAYGKFVGDE